MTIVNLSLYEYAHEKATNKELCLDQETKEFKEISKFDRLWDRIIEEFACNGMIEAALEQTGHILHSIPETIRRYYEVLMMEELNAPEYLCAVVPLPVIRTGTQEFQ